MGEGYGVDRGVRDNQLVGYGLVVGLQATGDTQQTTFPTQTLASMLLRMGVSVPASSIRVQNLAAVWMPGRRRPSERRKVAAGAHEFEAMMLQQMMRSLKFGQAPGDAGDEDAGGANGTLQSYGTERLAKGIARGGGFGIAEKIIRQVTAEDAAKGPAMANLMSGGEVR